MERVALIDAVGLVISADIESPLNLPPWDNSAMDGYAVRSSDFSGEAPHELEIVEEIPAGAFPQHELGAGQCARIFTGAPVPRGADCVIRQEDTTRLDDVRVRVDDTRDTGRNIRREGEDVHRGDTVLRVGTQLGPAQLGMLASVAEFEPPVHRRPVVAFMGSGDEIADADERDAILEGRKIASSNTYTVMALIREAGGEPLNLGVAKDDPADLRQRLLAAKDADLVVTTAGISVGEHDLLHGVLKELDVDQQFWRIRMRPGAPVAFGLIGALDGLPWIGLPGNPVSTMVTFELFVRPAIRSMLGHTLPYRGVTAVTTVEPIALGPPLRHFVRAKLSRGSAGLTARLTGPQGSGILSSMVHADGLLIVAEDRPRVESGESLDAIILNDTRHVEVCPW
jgi:molybdopterin molybdotransferase